MKSLKQAKKIVKAKEIKLKDLKRNRMKSLILSFLLILRTIFISGQDLNQTIQDAPFDLLESHIDYLNIKGIQNRTGGVVLLVHGTFTTGESCWGITPFNTKLFNEGPGFDVCWITLPFSGLADLQLSAEYIATAIPYLSKLSPMTNYKINIIGHSQGGGSNIQWALTLSATFKGSNEVKLICGLQSALGGCPPAILQLSSKSNYVAAQNSNLDRFSGAQSLVPTTSIYSWYDEAVQWEGFGGVINSFLEGAKMIALQDQKICGKFHLTTHVEMLQDSAAYSLVLDALINGRPTDITNFDKRNCHHGRSDWLHLWSQRSMMISAVWNFLFGDGRSKRIKDEFHHLRVPQEPGLQHYVCQRGYSKNCLEIGIGFPDVENLSKLNPHQSIEL
ncbi:hypothetical protein DFH28DRAFT_1150734 [Melampsora americana]|nr:hypothetical protein DFH28DRAFT_1150734 [Melampsora americana]